MSISSEEIVTRLCMCGYEAYTVGGAVRDILLGVDCNDEDIVTNAKPEDIRFLFTDHNVKVVGGSFPITLIDGNEVATYRQDTYYGLSEKNGQACFIETLGEDLKRRDFTYNAMAFCQYTGDIVDLFNGRRDLEHRVTRFVGDPAQRIHEDPCRILRACRFRAKTEGRFAGSTFKALQDHARHVREHVAPERVRKEILKAMKIRRPSLFFQSLKDIGVLEDVLPGLDRLCRLESGPYHAEKDVFEHAMLVGDALSPKRPLLRLTGYLHDLGKYPARAWDKNGQISFHDHDRLGVDIVRRDLKQLKFSNREIHYIAQLTRRHMHMLTLDSKPKAVRRLLAGLGAGGVDYRDWLRLRLADRRGNLKKKPHGRSEIRGFVNLIRAQTRDRALTPRDLAVDGWDVMTVLNIPPGPAVGAELKRLLDRVLENPELNRRPALVELLFKSRDA